MKGLPWNPPLVNPFPGNPLVRGGPAARTWWARALVRGAPRMPGLQAQLELVALYGTLHHTQQRTRELRTRGSIDAVLMHPYGSTALYLGGQYRSRSIDILYG